MAETLDGLQVWHKARKFWDAVNAILDRPRLKKDFKLHDQISDAIDSITSNISEGFAQPTDRAFANYLYHSKGSVAETRTRLQSACTRKYITQQEFDARNEMGDEVARMLTGLIKYLRRSDRKDRGLGPRPKPESDPQTRAWTKDRRPTTDDCRLTTDD